MAGLESATYINQLNPLNPSDTLDYVSTGDDHIRLIKSTVQNTFTRIAGPVSASDADLTNTTYLADTSATVNQVILTFSPVWTSYVAGKGAIFKAALTNTGAVTVKINALTAIALIGPTGNALTGGEIIAGGIYRITYDGSSFRLSSCDGYTRTPNLRINPYTGTNATIKNDSTGTLTVGTNGQSNITCNASGSVTIPTLTTTTATITNLTVGGVAMPFPSGTRALFAQSTAPTGWTQVTTDEANNRMLRVVNTSGGGTGGTHSPILMNVVPAHTHGFTTGGVSADHTHTFSTNTTGDHTHTGAMGGHAAGTAFGGGGVDHVSTNTGTSGAHSHSGTTNGMNVDHTHSGSTDNGSSQTNWTPKYINIIICSKN
ncbi:hypothetical protein [Methylobacter sp. YRD-M1]|uniref:hypothetical protein n=1 Tax=Methylobacter sp. YRD-M1 TaxID=2911520 RepID=UPI00227B6632|nr:hypothetical protein [Methylobacter sp. YRD-M1]WAK01869.1 hypothetical protein LZ558_18950 [Methylobacter sp. YRD-M1]